MTKLQQVIEFINTVNSIYKDTGKLLSIGIRSGKDWLEYEVACDDYELLFTVEDEEISYAKVTRYPTLKVTHTLIGLHYEETKPQYNHQPIEAHEFYDLLFKAY